MSLLDCLNDSDKNKILKQTLSVGDVLLKDFENVDHQKFFILAGICNEKIYICSVYINSNIHPSIMKKQNLLDLQVPIKRVDNTFLKHDSFANCAYPIPLDADKIIEQIKNNTCKIIGKMAESDMDNIRTSLKESGLLSDAEVEMYF